MRERLDCALVGTDCTDDWIRPWVGRHCGGRLYFHAPIASINIAHPESSRCLAGGAMLLRRFDVCLLPVSEQNLSWVRTSLLAARGHLSTPVLALIGQLKAAALNDLYELGLSDFVRAPLCPEELRVRIERLLDERREQALAWSPVPAAGAPRVAETPEPYTQQEPETVDETLLCSTILERTGLELDAYAAASARVAQHHASHSEQPKARLSSASKRLISRPRWAAIPGNIAMAARAAQKHRRAFWALMRKYDIDAAPYRSESPPKSVANK